MKFKFTRRIISLIVYDMKRIIITLFVVIGMTCSISAQNIKRPDSYLSLIHI